MEGWPLPASTALPPRTPCLSFCVPRTPPPRTQLGGWGWSGEVVSRPPLPLLQTQPPPRLAARRRGGRRRGQAGSDLQVK